MEWLHEPLQRKHVQYLSAQVGCEIQFPSVYFFRLKQKQTS